MDRFIDLTTKIAATLVIPLVIWGVRLEVELSVAQAERQNLRAEVSRLETQNQQVLQSVRENALTLRELTSSMAHVKERVDEIRSDLRGGGR